jgi:hypothetical protein
MRVGTSTRFLLGSLVAGETDFFELVWRSSTNQARDAGLVVLVLVYFVVNEQQVVLGYGCDCQAIQAVVVGYSCC